MLSAIASTDVSATHSVRPSRDKSNHVIDGILAVIRLEESRTRPANTLRTRMSASPRYPFPNLSVSPTAVLYLIAMSTDYVYTY